VAVRTFDLYVVDMHVPHHYAAHTETQNS